MGVDVRTDDEVVIELRAPERILALRRRRRIPLRCIAEVSTDPPRIPVLAIRAGTFWTRKGKKFYMLGERIGIGASP